MSLADWAEPPQYQCMAGYTISMQAAGEWADRVESFIADLRLHPLAYTEKYISPYTVLKCNSIDMKEVPGPGENSRLMFVTQCAPYNPDLDARMQQFQKCFKDNIVKFILDENGMLPTVDYLMYSLIEL